MKFIEIKTEELSVDVKEIIAIERRDEILSTVYTKAGTFDSDLPYRMLIDMLEGTQIPEKEEEIGLLSQMNDSLAQLKTNDQLFGG